MKIAVIVNINVAKISVTHSAGSSELQRVLTSLGFISVCSKALFEHLLMMLLVLLSDLNALIELGKIGFVVLVVKGRWSCVVILLD